MTAQFVTRAKTYSEHALSQCVVLYNLLLLVSLYDLHNTATHHHFTSHITAAPEHKPYPLQLNWLNITNA